MYCVIFYINFYFFESMRIAAEDFSSKHFNKLLIGNRSLQALSKILHPSLSKSKYSTALLTNFNICQSDFYTNTNNSAVWFVINYVSRAICLPKLIYGFNQPSRGQNIRKSRGPIFPTPGPPFSIPQKMALEFSKITSNFFSMGDK